VVRRPFHERVPRVGVGDAPGAQVVAHVCGHPAARSASRAAIRSSHGLFSVP
jgi:hypothetical protein